MKNKCSIYKKCGSCQYLEYDYNKQLEIKTKKVKELFNDTKLQVRETCPSPNQFNYRNKVIVAFNKKYDYGLYEENSHKIIPYKKCLLHEDIIDEIIKKIQVLFKKYRVSIYDEDKGRGLIRHVLIRRAVKTNQTMVVLVCKDNMFKGSKNFCKELIKVFPSIKTVVLNVNKRKTSIVLGNEEKVLYGKGFIVDELCALKFKISSKSFYQINHDQCEQLYDKALSLLELKGNEIAIDAYCGIGTIGMILSRKVKQVIGVELNKDAIKDANNNAKSNNINNIKFVCDDASKFMTQLASQKTNIDIVIMDPPRSGSTSEFIDAIATLNPKQVVYISCDPSTQARDIKNFKKKGYHAKDVYPYDMFPNTQHVESVVLLSKVQK